MVGLFQVVSHTKRCVPGSINEILFKWDPESTYLVQGLWDPGGPSYSSRSSDPMDLDNQGELKSYLDYSHVPGLSSFPSHPNAESSSKKPPRETRPYGELQVPT